jgi:hypothetical protein
MYGRSQKQGGYGDPGFMGVQKPKAAPPRPYIN